MQLPLLCEKSGAILLVLVSFTAGWQSGWQSDKILVDLKIFKILYGSYGRIFMAFNEGTVLL